MIASISNGVASIIFSGVGYFKNNPGVTMFTRTSVHWADKIVAIKSSNALR